ncbi:MAG: isochorismatase family protein [Bdellovibrio sp.]|nr:isochorismatase family protein [Bdellovibrio sp.]
MHSLVLSFLVFLGGSLCFAADEPMCSNTSGNSALIVIDMQRSFVESNGYYKRPGNIAIVEKLITEQKKAIKEAQAAGIPIVFFEYDDVDFGGPTEPQLTTAAMKGYRDVRVLKKTTDGMFDKKNKHLKDLKDFLQRNQIGTLIIAGANGGSCVKASIEGALKNNCNVVTHSAGVADFNFREFIYPYAGRLTEMKKLEKECESCTYKEVASAERLADSMINNNHRNSVGNSGGGGSPGTSSKPKNSTKTSR